MRPTPLYTLCPFTNRTDPTLFRRLLLLSAADKHEGLEKNKSGSQSPRLICGCASHAIRGGYVVLHRPFHGDYTAMLQAISRNDGEMKAKTIARAEASTEARTPAPLAHLGFHMDESDDDGDRWRSNIVYRWILRCGETAKGGNPARDHLANERTILAYIRTSLNMVICGLLLLQLSKYVVVAPINGMRNHAALDDTQQQIYDDVIRILDCVYRFSKPLGGLLLAISLATLVFGGLRYMRMFQLLFSDHDVFESGLLVNLVIFFSVIASVVLAFVYTYKL